MLTMPIVPVHKKLKHSLHNFEEHLRKRYGFGIEQEDTRIQETKIIDLSNDLVDRTQKLKSTSTFSIENTS